jgi:site-specific DNA-methyltransferase (adenine-specific)
MDKLSYILTRAEELARETDTWADLSNALFDPLDGEVTRTFAGADERKAFRRTPAYRRIRSLLQAKMRETGLVSGAAPRKSGRFLVRVPSSLHAALENEARAEGTSLNQLVLTKLAVQLDTLADGRLGRIIRAFGETRFGHSADRVIADPQLNRKFLQRCRELGLSGTDFELSWELMNARKSRELSQLPKTKRTTFKESDEFEYASELAVRFLQRTRDPSPSLDQIMCDPDLASEFDEYARRLAPGFTPLQYRWAALGLRKAGRLKPSSQKIGELPRLEALGAAASLRLHDVPEESGLYLFSSAEEPVFMSQTENLRHRLEKHLNTSSGRGLPDWLWPDHTRPLRVEIAPAPGTSRRIRQAMEVLLIARYRPALNYHRKAA